MAEDMKPGFWGWASKHWFLTALLAASAIAVPAQVVAAARAPAKPPTPPANPNVGTAPPFKPGDVVLVDVAAANLQSVTGLGNALPLGNATVRIDQLTPPSLTPDVFSGFLIAPVQQALSIIMPRSAVTGVVSRA